MNAMAPTRPTGLYQRRIRLTREPAAAAEARSQVRATIRDWKVPVDPDIAILLASDLVTNAITHGQGETVTLAMRCTREHLRIDVYDKSRYLPADASEPVGAATGHGLVLVAALSADWGSFRTPAGKAMYFTLALQPDPLLGGDRGCGGLDVGTASCQTPSGSPSSLAARQETQARARYSVGPTVTGPLKRPRPGSYWVKSSLSYANGNCVEVASLPGGTIGVRNSRDTSGPVLRFTSAEWHAFLGGVRNGEFDRFGR